MRVIGATHRHLEDEVREGRFREDLYFRLTPIMIPLPPLRDRIEDVPLLAARLLGRACRRHDRPEVSLSTGALSTLVGYRWPGNVRELENELLRAVAVSGDKTVLEASDLSPRIQSPDSTEIDDGSAAASVTPGPTAIQPDPLLSSSDKQDASLRGAVSRFERQHIEDVLEQNQGNVSATARALGVSRGALHRKLKDFGLR